MADRIAVSCARWGVEFSFPGLQFCAEVPPGNARAKECLEDSREQPGFSPQCKVEVEKMMESRASDFRLDPKLRQLCADDIQVNALSVPCYRGRHWRILLHPADNSLDCSNEGLVET